MDYRAFGFLLVGFGVVALICSLLLFILTTDVYSVLMLILSVVLNVIGLNLILSRGGKK
ncbi:MAG: hypothetical protein IJY82_07940 [Oscillospiraceae bacterium]|nr:hypothetical protein [Oscillospiraceae bacterium]